MKYFLLICVYKAYCIISSKKITIILQVRILIHNRFIIIFRETDLIYDEQLDPVMRKMEVARLIAPKIAYQWFSNVFSLSHFWLHDGLATLFGEEAIAKVSTFIILEQYQGIILNFYIIIFII